QHGQSDPLPPQAAVKLAPDLLKTFATSSNDDCISVIVKTDGNPLSALLKSLPHSAKDSTSYRPLGLEDLFAVSLSKDQMAHLLRSQEVLHVSPDRPLYLSQDYATQTVGANIAWNKYGLAGSGVTVAVLDTGVYTHPDLGPKTNRL